MIDLSKYNYDEVMQIAVDNIDDADVVIVNTCYVKLPTENKIIYKIQPFYCMLHQK